MAGKYDREQLRAVFDPATTPEEQIALSDPSKSHKLYLRMFPGGEEEVADLAFEVAEEVAPGLYSKEAIADVVSDWKVSKALDEILDTQVLLMMNPGLHPYTLNVATWFSRSFFKNNGYEIVLKHNPSVSFLFDSEHLSDYWKYVFLRYFFEYQRARFLIPLAKTMQPGDADDRYVTFSQENAMLFLRSTFGDNEALALTPAYIEPYSQWSAQSGSSEITLDDLFAAKTAAEERAIAGKFCPRIRRPPDKPEHTAHFVIRMMVHEHPVRLDWLFDILRSHFTSDSPGTTEALIKNKTPLGLAAELTRMTLLLEKMAPEIAHVPLWFLKATGFDISEVPPLPAPRARRSRKETG